MITLKWFQMLPNLLGARYELRNVIHKVLSRGIFAIPPYTMHASMLVHMWNVSEPPYDAAPLTSVLLSNFPGARWVFPLLQGSWIGARVAVNYASDALTVVSTRTACSVAGTRVSKRIRHEEEVVGRQGLLFTHP